MLSTVTSNLSRSAARSASSRLFRCLHATPQVLAKLNVEGLAERVNLEGQNVLMRVDLNVPLSKEVRFSFQVNLILKLFF